MAYTTNSKRTYTPRTAKLLPTSSNASMSSSVSDKLAKKVDTAPTTPAKSVFDLKPLTTVPGLTSGTSPSNLEWKTPQTIASTAPMSSSVADSIQNRINTPTTTTRNSSSGGNYTPTPNPVTQTTPGNGDTPPESEDPFLNSGDPGAPSGGGGGGGGFGGLRNDYAAASAGDKAEMAAMMSGMLSYIDQLGSQVMGQIRSQMGMDDPETANAIAMIREEADSIYKEMLEDLNAKGLVQSGIYAEAQDRITKNQGMQVSNFVAQRFGDLQNQLNQAMMSIGQMKTGAMSSNIGMVNSSNMNDRNTMANIGVAGLQNATTQRGQDIQNSQFSQNFDWQKSVDTRNFGYGQERDAIGDQQFSQQLGAQYAGNGGGLSWEQQQGNLANQYEAYNNAEQFIQTYGQPKTPEEYAQVIRRIDMNPLFGENVSPGIKDYVKNSIKQPTTTQGGSTFADLFGGGGYTPASSRSINDPNYWNTVKR